MQAFIKIGMCLSLSRNRVPFDLTEGESELVSRFNVEYSSSPLNHSYTTVNNYNLIATCNDYRWNYMCVPAQHKTHCDESTCSSVGVELLCRDCIMHTCTCTAQHIGMNQQYCGTEYTCYTHGSYFFSQLGNAGLALPLEFVQIKCVNCHDMHAASQLQALHTMLRAVYL